MTAQPPHLAKPCRREHLLFSLRSGGSLPRHTLRGDWAWRLINTHHRAPGGWPQMRRRRIRRKGRGGRKKKNCPQALLSMVGPAVPIARLGLTVPCAQECLPDTSMLLSKAFLPFELLTALPRGPLSSQSTPARSRWSPHSECSGQSLPTQPRGSWAPAFLPPRSRRTLPSVPRPVLSRILSSGKGPLLALVPMCLLSLHPML